MWLAMCNTQLAPHSIHHAPRCMHHAPHGWDAGLRTAAKKRRTIGEADLDERCVEYLQSVSDEVAAIGGRLPCGTQQTRNAQRTT